MVRANEGLSAQLILDGPCKRGRICFVKTRFHMASRGVVVVQIRSLTRSRKDTVAVRKFLALESKADLGVMVPSD